MNYFKRNPNALPILLGTLIFMGIMAWASVKQGTFDGPEKAPATAGQTVE